MSCCADKSCQNFLTIKLLCKSTLKIIQWKEITQINLYFVQIFFNNLTSFQQKIFFFQNKNHPQNYNSFNTLSDIVDRFYYSIIFFFHPFFLLLLLLTPFNVGLKYHKHNLLSSYLLRRLSSFHFRNIKFENIFTLEYIFVIWNLDKRFIIVFYHNKNILNLIKIGIWIVTYTALKKKAT